MSFYSPAAAGVTDHGALTGLSDDDHSIYALLAGRSGGQTVKGGTGSGDNLTLQSTNHATKGKVVLGAGGTSAYDEVNDRLGIGTASPGRKLDAVSSSNPQLRLSYTAGSVYVEFQTLSNGSCLMTTTGSSGVLKVGADPAAGAYVLQVGGTLGAFFDGPIRGRASAVNNYTWDLSSVTSSGDMLTAGILSTGASSYNLVLKPGNAATLQLITYNGSAYKSVLEYTANTEAFLRLCKGGGGVAIGSGALSTSATSGFLHIPTCAGTPTGTPANAVSGLAALVVDSTNNKLYGYYGAAWHDLTGS